MNLPEVPHLFCFGMGYTARRLARACFAEGWRVTGTERPATMGDEGDEADSQAVVEAGGFATFPFDRDHPLDDFDGLFETVSHVLVSVPPDSGGDAVLENHGEDLARHGGHIQWLGYLSTVGVYGNTRGRWVDETAPLLPTQERSRFRALAENRWQNLAARAELPLHVFRLAGIYGPGRSAFDKVRNATARAIVKPRHAFSRIHADDVVNVLKASINKPDPGAIYNVCDDEPAEPAKVTQHAVQLLGLAPLPEIPFSEATAEMGDMQRSFWADNRRVRNTKIKEELGVKLDYPTYREGLKAILKANG